MKCKIFDCLGQVSVNQNCKVLLISSQCWGGPVVLGRDPFLFVNTASWLVACFFLKHCFGGYVEHKNTELATVTLLVLCDA